MGTFITAHGSPVSAIAGLSTWDRSVTLSGSGNSVLLATMVGSATGTTSTLPASLSLDDTTNVAF